MATSRPGSTSALTPCAGRSTAASVGSASIGSTSCTSTIPTTTSTKRSTGAHRALVDLREQGVIERGLAGHELRADGGDVPRPWRPRLRARRRPLHPARPERCAGDPQCAERGVAYLAAGVFNSGVLARPAEGAWYDYAPASASVLDRSRRIEQVCRRHGVALPAAALSFPFMHPDVSVVIVGMARPHEVDENIEVLRVWHPRRPLDRAGRRGPARRHHHRGRIGMKIESVRAVLTGHRILNPEMQRSWALVRIETDTGTVGWGEASTNWGHSYPTVFRAVVEDVCSRHLEGRDPLAIRDRVADLKVALDGYLGWEGLSSQTIGAIEIALWDILGKTLGAPDPPAPRRAGLPDPALRDRHDDVRAVARLARALLRPVRQPRVQGRQGAPRAAPWTRTSNW